jgi:hypothetical protein
VAPKMPQRKRVLRSFRIRLPFSPVGVKCKQKLKKDQG